MNRGSQLDLFAAAPVARGGVATPPPGLGPTPALPRRIPAEGAELVASVLGTAVPLRLRRGPRARRVRLTVDRSAVLTLVLPRRFSVDDVPAVLEEHARWILRTLERLSRRARVQRPALADGREITFFGARRVVRLAEAPITEPARVRQRGEEMLVSVPPLHPRSAAEVLRGWLRAAASREIPAKVGVLNGPLGFHLGRVSVRDQRTKWGACSARGNVSINWRLSLAPPEVLDYVILHELCHLRELNHSRRFWNLLRSVRPGFEGERAWLRENGDLLDV